VINKIPVGLWRLTVPKYPDVAPYDPSAHYPEIDNPIIGNGRRNEVYDAVRRILAILGLDKERYGTRKWNPLRTLVPEGGTCVIKPNLVSEPRESNTNPYSVTTHASVVRPLVDYSLKAVGESGRVVVADAPQFDSDFERVIETNGLSETISILSERIGRPIPLLDLRAEKAIVEGGVVTRRIRLNGDPLGYTLIDLGERSCLTEVEDFADRFRGSDYDRAETISHQNGGHHEYSIANTILTANCVISVPKLKTHKKAGVTLNLKNFVGINGSKNFIPHYRVGTTYRGGDEMAEPSLKGDLLSYAHDSAEKLLPKLKQPGINLMRHLGKIDKKVTDGDETLLRAGDWRGNDTIWRCILDLYFILLFATTNRSFERTPQRNLLGIIDGVIAGEGNGPLHPESRSEGLVVGGESLVATDLTAIAAMGHDFNSYPTYSFLKEPLVQGSIADFANRIEVETSEGRRVSIRDLRESVDRPFDFPDGWK
jgi:uncharacterized protein (DUF362 family)